MGRRLGTRVLVLAAFYALALVYITATGSGLDPHVHGADSLDALAEGGLVGPVVASDRPTDSGPFAAAAAAVRRLLDCPEEATDDEPDVDDNPNYPRTGFTAKQRRNGAFLLYVLGILYMFIGLAVICDEYFVPALEVIVEKTGISEDVAGATFMAAGGSMPELFTSFIGVFIAKSNVGFGTIVGSAVFNVLFVIGMCAIFSSGALVLTWWPLFRDASFYAVDLAVLVICFSDGKIEWFEALILFCLYLLYVLFMRYNEPIEHMVKSKLRKMKGLPPLPRESVDEEAQQDQEKRVTGSTSIRGRGVSHFRMGALEMLLRNVDPIGKGPHHNRDTRMKRAALMVLESNHQNRLAAAASKSSEENKDTASTPKPSALALLAGEVSRKEAAKPDAGKPDAGKTETDAGKPDAAAASSTSVTKSPSPEPADLPVLIASNETDDEKERKRAAAEDYEYGDDKAEDEAEDEETGLSMAWPDNTAGRIWYVILFPLSFLFFITTPNVTVEKWRPWFPLTFINSILWIGCLSYFMVWWATVFGQALGIPSSILGLTLLAAGTSVPDLITSVIVAKRGEGDMAVSSSLGSNIFDVTVGLPVPWLIFSLVQGCPIIVGNTGLGVSVLLLLLMLAGVIGCIMYSGWVMSRALGYAMFCLYAVFITIALLLELDVIPLLF